MRLIPDFESLIDTAVTGWDHVVGPGVADLTRTPSSIIHEAPQCTVRRYRSRRRARADRSPILLVPPLAAPATCFDLRRGCSLAEHLTALGYPTYLVDYGAISFSDRALGLEHWVEDVIPTAVDRVWADAGGRPVQIVGWCLGGILTLLAVAGDRELPVASVAMVASPFDFARLRMFPPIRRLANLTGGWARTCARARSRTGWPPSPRRPRAAPGPRPPREGSGCPQGTSRRSVPACRRRPPIPGPRLWESRPPPNVRGPARGRRRRSPRSPRDRWDSRAR